MNLANEGRIKTVRTRIGYLYDPASVEEFKNNEGTREG